MAADRPARTGGPPIQRARFGVVRALRAAWPFLLAALVLLIASEVLWLWHSWPLRELLDTERAIVGAAS